MTQTIQEALGMTKFTVRFRPFNDDKRPYKTDVYNTFEEAYDQAISLMRKGFNDVKFSQR